MASNTGPIPLPKNKGRTTPSKGLRRDKIVQFTAQNPMTKQELADRIGVSYYTIRDDIEILTIEGRIRAIDSGKNGSIYYSSKSNVMGHWPVLWRSLDKSQVWNFKEAITWIINKGTWLDGMSALSVSAIELMHGMLRIADVKSAPTSDRQLKTYRNNLRQAIEVVRADLIMLECFANNDIFWTNEGIEQLAQIDDQYPLTTINRIRDHYIPEFGAAVSSGHAIVKAKVDSFKTPVGKDKTKDNANEADKDSEANSPS